MAERRRGVGRSVEEPEKSSAALRGQLEKPEPGVEGGWGEDVVEEAAKGRRFDL